MYLQVLILLFICAIVHSSKLPSPELHVKYGGQALTALERLLNFFESDINNLNLDGLYGLRIAQGQLNILHQILTSPSLEKSPITDKNNYIQSLSIKIERIANKSLTEIAQKASSYLHRFALLTVKPFLLDYDLRKINKKYLDQGERISEFDEDESDVCFAELLGSSDRPNATKCFITQSCWLMMTSPMTTDYRLTHQLLWFLIAKNIGCIDHRSVSNLANKNLKYLEDRYCSNIYDDARNNYQQNDNQDLFLEQLLLCSIVGYEEFLRLDWFHTILTWQHAEYGCFRSESNSENFNFKAKRHLLVEQDMNNGCLSHKSGLASGVLATYARAFLQ